MDRKEFLSQLWKRLSTKLIWIAVLVLLYIVAKVVLEMIDGFNSTTIDWSAMALTIATILGAIVALSILYLIIQYVRGLANLLYLKMPETTKFNLRVARRTLNAAGTLAIGASLYYAWMKEPFVAVVMGLALLRLTVIESIRKEKETNNAPTHTPPQA